MTGFINRIDVNKPSLYAFEITGKVSKEDMETMAKTMNAAFDAHKDKIDILLVFTDYDGSEFGATLDDDVIASRFRAITNVGKYVVVGAPDTAESAINLFGKLLPVETHTFELSEIDKAWRLLGTSRSAITA